MPTVPPSFRRDDQIGRGATFGQEPRRFGASDTAGVVLILASGFALAWLDQRYPTGMPWFAPRDFGWGVFLALTFVLWWFLRGLAIAPPAQRLPLRRQILFLAGLVVVYAVSQTGFAQEARQMFLFNRVQQVGLHYVGPFLIALAWPGATIRRGMPPILARTLASPGLNRLVSLLRRPAIAATLFLASFLLWLIPRIAAPAVLNPVLYHVMNWSSLLGGLLFWCVVLDPRPRSEAGASFGMRAALAAGVMFPVIVIAAVIALRHRDLYPSYQASGGLWPGIGPSGDQLLGGLVMWLPPAAASSAAVLFVLHAIRLHDEATLPTDVRSERRGSAIECDSSRWTGR